MDNSCVNSARNKDIRKVLSVHFTDRLTDFRATLYSGAKSSKEHTEFILQQSGRLCSVQQAAMYHTYSARQHQLFSYRQQAWIRSAGFTAECKSRKMNHSPRVNSKHGLQLHHSALPLN